MGRKPREVVLTEFTVDDRGYLPYVTGTYVRKDEFGNTDAPRFRRSELGEVRPRNIDSALSSILNRKDDKGLADD